MKRLNNAKRRKIAQVVAVIVIIVMAASVIAPFIGGFGYPG